MASVSDTGEWAQHDISQGNEAPLIHQLLRSSLRRSGLFPFGRDASSHASPSQRMDGISEESPLAGVISVWDHVEGFIYDYPSLPLALCVAGIYLSFCRSFKSVAVLIGISGWRKRATLLDVLDELLPLGIIFQALVVGLVVWICVKLILPWVSPDDDRNYDGPSLPYLIPSRTTHTRLTPKRHSFGYSYLLVGIPVEWQGNANGMVAVDAGKKSRYLGSHRAWYNVKSDEYLERGTSHHGLRGKLNDFLRSQVRDNRS